MRFLYAIIFTFLFLPFSGISQIYDPVDWNFSKQKISDNTYELIFTADIDSGWAMYSNDIYDNGVDCDVEICPIPVSFEFNKNNEQERYFRFIGDIVEVDENKKTSQDPIFLMEVTKFTDRATFKQIIEIDTNDIDVTGYLTFMVCDDTKCLPPTDVEFVFSFGQSNKKDSGNISSEFKKSKNL